VLGIDLDELAHAHNISRRCGLRLEGIGILCILCS
jgi:hypothetical protein